MCLVNLFPKKVNIVTQNVNERLPQECTNITEVRQEIDHIDYEIIRLLATRFGYVREVVKYKENNDKAIEAPDRRAAVIKSRGEWAREMGLSADVVEELYNRLIDYYIEEEKKLLR